jgi:hypothetical protein
MKAFPLVLCALLFTSLPSPVDVAAQQSSLPLGTVSGITQLPECPSYGFYAGITCFQAQVSCPNTAALGVIYGVENPGEIPKGTVLFHGGSGGTVPYGTTDYAQPYLQAGFQIVQLAWDSDWEDTGLTIKDIKTAACRPATFINFVFQSVHSTGAMCAHGFSAGSAAVAYTLAWYGGANFLDKVELLSGPVFSDIEKGCEVPNAPVMTVCPPGEYGCNGASWPDSPAYVGAGIAAVASWTGDSSCNGSKRTKPDSNAEWKAMSIVDGTNNPSFNYPNTGMAGWLCSNDDRVQNNSASQGDLFYQQFTSSFQTAGYSVTRIDECEGDEGVDQGFTPQGVLGQTAVTEDMVNSCTLQDKR